MAQDLATLYPAHLQYVQDVFQRALAVGGYDGVVVCSGVQQYYFLDDRPVPYKVNPLFAWWAPLQQHPSSYVVFEPSKKPRLVYFQPHDYWHVVPAKPSSYWVDGFELVICHDSNDLQAALPKPTAQWAVLGDQEPWLNEWSEASRNPKPLLDFMHYHRAAKTSYEIQCMRAATSLAVAGHQAAAEAFHAGLSEFEIQQQYLAATGQSEGEMPYGNIVALNEHGAVLHYQYHDKHAPDEFRSFLIDAGASFAGYAADITRTYIAEDGAPEFRALLAGMDAIQQTLVGELKVGVSYGQVHASAHRQITALLTESGVVRCGQEQAMELGLSQAFFPHGLGHLIGLQVHDVGGFLSADTDAAHVPPPKEYPYLRLTREMQEGFAVTIEPGLYFIDMLLKPWREGKHKEVIDWALVDRLQPYGGIRIEDDVLVTGDGAVNLTREAGLT